MKESHGKDPARHPGSESCGVDREVAAEALTGENADQVLSCEIKQLWVPTLLLRYYCDTQHVNTTNGVFIRHSGPNTTLCVHSLCVGVVYLHYVIDLWVRQWWTRTASGDVIIVRYADDYAMGFQHRVETETIPERTQGTLAQVRIGVAL